MSERYLYLREQMAIRDKESQLRSAENRGRLEGRKRRKKTGRNFKINNAGKEKD